MTLHNHKCPACSSPLQADDDGSGRQIAWCSNGRCISEQGDNGALGDTAEQAAQNLIKQMLDKPDWD